MESLKVSNLCKTYIIEKRQNNVLRNVNLEIEQGEMVAVMGPSGSGKTTLLYTVSGMDNATAGKVDFFGREMTGLTANEISDMRLEQMGFVFQQMYMLKNLSIYDNIIMPSPYLKAFSITLSNTSSTRSMSPRTNRFSYLPICSSIIRTAHFST